MIREKYCESFYFYNLVILNINIFHNVFDERQGLLSKAMNFVRMVNLIILLSETTKFKIDFLINASFIEWD